MSNSERKKGLGAAARVSAIAASVMDLHVRIALQEVDREKRRLISGGIFLAMGGGLMLLSLIAFEVALVYWLNEKAGLTVIFSSLIVALLDIFLAGLSLRVGGHLVKGPYLPETFEGISKTTKAVFGRN